MAVAVRLEPARRWGGVVVSVLAVAAVVWWGLHQESPRLPQSAGHLAYLGAAIALYAVATLVRGWRWHEILRRLGAGHSTTDAYALVTVGYMGNAVLPARGGEVLRTVLLAGRSGTGKREVLGSIVTERALDAVSLALLFVTLTWMGIAGSPLGQRPALLAVALLALGAAGAWLARRVARRPRFAPLMARLRPYLLASRPLLGRHGFLLVLVSLVVWLLEGTIFWLVATSLGLSIGIVEGVFLAVLSALAALIPAAPGYLGTFDAALIFGLKALGVAGGAAVGFALTMRFVLFVPITVVGLGIFLTRYGGFRNVAARLAAGRSA
jgi:uncharacterized membrane protein YbhN (UPF0104 family)